MDCTHAQRELAGRAQVVAEVQRHVDDCEACRRFAADVHAIAAMSESPVATPPVVREQTLDECLSLLTEQNAARDASWRQRLSAVWDTPQFIVLAAALGLLIVGIVTAVQFKDARESGVNLPVALTIGQFVIQNFIAALFLPILLMMKHRLAGRTPQMGE
jgi:predicted anti-sigma-YlaC factor YlaD